MAAQVKRMGMGIFTLVCARNWGCLKDDDSLFRENRWCGVC